jgi:hypothetical protein
MYEDYIKYIAKKNGLSKIIIKNNKLMKFYTMTSSYLFYLLSTNPEILNDAKEILRNSNKPEKNIMDLFSTVDMKNFRSMLKSYDTQDIRSLFSIIHKILNNSFEILKGICKAMDKPFDISAITKTQKNFSEHFVIPLVKSFIEDEQAIVKSHSFKVFENK